jgi:multimeric flavodoxin WrbA
MGVVLGIRHLRAYEMKVCGACGDCNNLLMPCEQQDGVSELVDQMKDADGVIYAAPVHAFGVPAHMQTFLERAGVGYLRHERPLTNKVAGFIVTSNGINGHAAYDQLLNNALLNRMIVAGSGMPPVLKGRNPGEALQHQEGMTAVSTMLGRMVELVHGLRRAGMLGANDLPNERVLEEKTEVDALRPTPLSRVDHQLLPTVSL